MQISATQLNEIENDANIALRDYQNETDKLCYRVFFKRQKYNSL